jgi:hypothetical protein
MRRHFLTRRRRAITVDFIETVSASIAIGAAMTYIMIRLRRFLHDRRDYYLCKIYQDLGDKAQMLVEREVDRTAEDFVSGQFQFVTDSQAVKFYEKGHPVLEYHLDRTLPLIVGKSVADIRIMLSDKHVEELKKKGVAYKMSGKIAPKILERVAQPHETSGNGMKNPSARTMKRFVKDKFIEQLANATRSFSLRQFLPLALLCVVVGLAMGYVIVNLYHPGLVPAAPQGYSYQIVKDNVTATASTTTTFGHPTG